MNVTEIGNEESRKHHKFDGYCQRDNAEGEGYDRVPTGKRITENNITDADRKVDGLLEQILEVSNLNKAYEALKLKLKPFVVGWLNYFKLADMISILKNADEWLRRRLRMFIWKRWKKVKTRYRRLKQLAYNHSNAIRYANTRKGYWVVARSQILTCSIRDDRLRKSGYIFFSDYYECLLDRLTYGAVEGRRDYSISPPILLQ